MEFKYIVFWLKKWLVAQLEQATKWNYTGLSETIMD